MLTHSSVGFNMTSSSQKARHSAPVRHFVVKRRKVKSLSHVQLFGTPWTVAVPGSSVHGIFQARILEWIAISFSRRSSRPGE